MKTFFLLLDAVVSEDGFGMLQQESSRKTRKKERKKIQKMKSRKFK